MLRVKFSVYSSIYILYGMFFLSITAGQIKKTAFLLNSHLHRKSRICYKALPDKQVKFLHLGAENIPLFLRQKCKHVSQGPLVDNDQTLLKYMLWFNINLVFLSDPQHTLWPSIETGTEI